MRKRDVVGEKVGRRGRKGLFFFGKSILFGAEPKNKVITRHVMAGSGGGSGEQGARCETRG